MNKVLLCFVCNAIICLLPVSSAAQGESGVVADGLIVLAEVPLRIYPLEGRQPLDLPSLPELTPMSHIPMGDHPLLPATINVIGIVQNQGDTPVESVEVELFVDRQVGEAIEQGELSQERRVERSLMNPLGNEHPPHPSSVARWEGAVHIESRFFSLLDGNETIAVHFEQRAETLWQHLVPNREWPWQVRYELQVNCVSCSSDRVSTHLLLADSPPVALEAVPQGLQQLVDKLLASVPSRDAESVYRTLAPDFEVKRDFGGGFDPNSSPEENFNNTVFGFDNVADRYRNSVWRRFERWLTAPIFERKSYGQFCTPHGALHFDRTLEGGESSPRFLIPITVFDRSDFLVTPQLCFKSADNGPWEIASFIWGGD